MNTISRHVQATTDRADDLPEHVAQIFKTRKQIFVFLDVSKPARVRFKVLTKGHDLYRAEKHPNECVLVGTYTRECDMGALVEDAECAQRDYCASLRIVDTHRFVDSGNELSEYLRGQLHQPDCDCNRDHD